MNSYCPLPFRHVFVEPRGIKPCCSYTNTFNGSIEQWLNSSELYQLQQDLLGGKINSGCAHCIANEHTDGYSTRIGSLTEYPTTVTDTKIDYIDYRSKNICNFKCRSCEPYFSNGIAQDVRKNTDLIEFFQIPPDKIAEVTDSDWILKNIKQIRRLMFTGGEPTKIPEVKQILNYINDNQLDTNVQIISNGSFTDVYWKDITKQLPNINWTISLDAIKHAAEIIRHGTEWDIVSNNVEWLFEHSPSVNISTVVTNLNLMQLTELFDFVNTLEKKYQHRHNGRTQFIEICNWPDYLTPYNWPAGLKGEVLNYLNSIDLDSLHLRQREVIVMLKSNISAFTFNNELWNKSKKLNLILDKIRNQQHQTLWHIKS